MMTNKNLIYKMVGVSHKLLQESITEAKKISENAFHYDIDEHYNDFLLKITFNDSITNAVANQIEDVLSSKLKDYIYSRKNEKIAKCLFDLIKQNQALLSVGESFTGGGIVKSLIEISGASEILYEGVVAYSNQAKMDRLGVSFQTLLDYGSVSKETVTEMVKGLLKTDRCNIALATTGVAGPSKDEKGNPVGLCYIGVGSEYSVEVHQFNLSGDRNEITRSAINIALFVCYKYLRFDYLEKL